MKIRFHLTFLSLFLLILGSLSFTAEAQDLPKKSAITSVSPEDIVGVWEGVFTQDTQTPRSFTYKIILKLLGLTDSVATYEAETEWRWVGQEAYFGKMEAAATLRNDTLYMNDKKVLEESVGSFYWCKKDHIMVYTETDSTVNFIGAWTSTDTLCVPGSVNVYRVREEKEVEEEMEEEVDVNVLTEGITAYPNPFFAETTIELVIKEADNYRLAVYDLTGRLVKTLFEGSLEDNTFATIQFKANHLPSALYIIQMEGTTAGVIDKEKVSLIR